MLYGDNYIILQGDPTIIFNCTNFAGRMPPILNIFWDFVLRDNGRKRGLFFSHSKLDFLIKRNGVKSEYIKRTKKSTLSSGLYILIIKNVSTEISRTFKRVFRLTVN